MSTPNERIQTLVEEFNSITQQIQELSNRQLEIKGAVEALNSLLEADPEEAS